MPRKILHVPSRYSPSAKHYLIFFITGNPGLISYYTSFLATLNHLFSQQSSSSGPSSQVFHIFGQSLAGFEDEDVSTDKTCEESWPYGLTDEIELTFNALKSLKISTGERMGEAFDGIILIGHSVGSYILLELLNRNRQNKSSERLKVEAGILLFPTVTYIAQSPSGLKITKLFRLPDIPRMASVLVRALLWPLPRTALNSLVAFVTGMPEDTTEVTVDFLMSERGVWQAL